MVRQLLAQRLLAVEGDYGTLVLTEESGEVLGRRREVMMRREPERARSRVEVVRRRRRPAGRPAPRGGAGVRAAARVAGRRRQGAGRSGVRHLPRRDAAADRHRPPRRRSPSSARSAASARTNWPSTARASWRHSPATRPCRAPQVGSAAKERHGSTDHNLAVSTDRRPCLRRPPSPRRRAFAQARQRECWCNRESHRMPVRRVVAEERGSAYPGRTTPLPRPLADPSDDAKGLGCEPSLAGREVWARGRGRGRHSRRTKLRTRCGGRAPRT